MTWHDANTTRKAEFAIWTRSEKKAQFGLSEPQGFDGFDLFTSEDWDEQSLAIQAAEKAGIESGTSFWCGFRYI